MLKCNICKQSIEDKKSQYYGQMIDASDKNKSVSLRVCKSCINKLIK